jgi:NAD(P)-dependent dehydrogenase (short-subunit alcohol dehydrogenase family)
VPVAIVTGSDSGIGRATAVALARDGYDIGVTWHADEPGAGETADEVRATGRRAEVRRLDLSDAANGPPVVDELADALGGLDVLVNNAGTGDSTPFLEIELATWRHILETDLTGAFLCAQAAARRMVAAGRGGRIVNVTSIHEHVPLAGSAPYCASKGGLGLLTQVMALELAAHGITVNSVAPGEVSTPMTGQEEGPPGFPHNHDRPGKAVDGGDPHAQERPGIPARRPGDAREIAALIAFICRGEAAYLTGESIVIDGGLHLMAAQQDRQAP